MAGWSEWLGIAKDIYGVAEPFVNFGIGQYENNQREQYVADYSQYLQDKEQRDYDRYLAEVAALQGGAGVKAGFLEQALAQQAMAREQILALYAPFIDSAKRLLPQQEALANQGLAGVSQLWNTINTPEMNARINNIPISGIETAQQVIPKGIIR